MYGEAAIPAHWLNHLEAREVIAQVADDLHDLRQWDLENEFEADRMWERYPGW